MLTWLSMKMKIMETGNKQLQVVDFHSFCRIVIDAQLFEMN